MTTTPLPRLLLLIVLLLGTACTSQAQGGADPTPAPDDPLIAHYGAAMQPASVADLTAESAGRPTYALDVALTVESDEVRFAGVETVHVTNPGPDPWDRVVFRLYPNLDSYGGDLTIHSAAVNDAPVTPELDESRTVLAVPLAEPLPPDATATITLDFTTTLTPGAQVLYNQFSYLHGTLATPNFFPLLSVYDPGAGWWDVTAHPQGDAVYSETALFDVRLTAPSDMVIATSGVTVEALANDDDTTTYTIIAPLMRDFALMGSAGFEMISTTVGDVRVNVYAQQDDSAAQAALDLAATSVRVFTENFGAYPFAELDVVETPTAAGGIEYPGLIVIAEDVWNPGTAYFETVIVHEAAHQWWYSLVGNDQTTQPWLDESLTQYSVAVYFRAAVSNTAAERFLGGLESRVDALPPTEDAVIGLPVAEYGNRYFDIVYAKGPLFFDMLADLTGEEALLDMLADYFAAFRYDVATPAGMLASFEDSLGRDDLDGIFTRWVGEF